MLCSDGGGRNSSEDGNLACASTMGTNRQGEIGVGNQRKTTAREQLYSQVVDDVRWQDCVEIEIVARKEKR